MPIINYATTAPATVNEWTFYAPVISALIASFITIAGIVLNNYFARKHKKEEQEHSIKKEIYLDFAEYVSISMAMLQAATNPKSDLQDLIVKYNDHAGIIGKMYVVAEPQLLLEARSLVTELEECASEMVAMRQGIDKSNSNVESLKALRSETSKALDNLTEHHLSLIRTGNIPEDRVGAALQWERDFTTKRLNELDDSIYKAEVEAYHSTLKLFELGIVASQNVEEKSLTALGIIKEQLGIAHDFVNYEKAVKIQSKKRVQSARNLIETRMGSSRISEKEE